jgi:hypothetical protein
VRGARVATTALSQITLVAEGQIIEEWIESQLYAD